MKKTISLITALVMMVCLSVNAFAASNFVTSVEQKSPTVDLTVSYITDSEGNTTSLDEIDAAIVTALNLTTSGDDPADLDEEAAAEYSDAVALLLEQYAAVQEASSLLDVIGENDVLDSSKTYVCIDMIDVSFFNEGREAVDAAYASGGSVTMTFDIGAAANTQIYVAVYTDGAWVMLPASACVNNNDGTVTVTFTADCPVMFIQEVTDASTSEVTSPQTSDVAPFYAIMAVCCVMAAAGCFIVARKKNH